VSVEVIDKLRIDGFSIREHGVKETIERQRTWFSVNFSSKRESIKVGLEEKRVQKQVREPN